MSDPARATDERILGRLALFRSGQSLERIAKRCGMSRDAVAAALKRVRDADLAESGELEAVVRGGYR